MIKKFKRSLVIAAALIAAFYSLQAYAQGPSFSPKQKQEIQEIIDDYLKSKPELVIEAIRIYQARQKQSELDFDRIAIDKYQKDLFNDPTDPVGGNLKGDVTLVEFFDYRCSYCKRVHPVVKKLLEQDKNIRFVYKEFPILGPVSDYAARAALASQAQRKYKMYQDKLMAVRGGLTQDRILSIADNVGLDKAKLIAEMSKRKPEFSAIIEKNLKLAQKLRISGTPAFVIGDVIVRGATDLASLQRVIEAARTNRNK